MIHRHRQLSYGHLEQCPDDTLSEIWINATLSPSQEFAIKQDEGKEKQTIEQIVPLEYHKYLDVFQEEVERFPKA